MNNTFEIGNKLQTWSGNFKIGMETTKLESKPLKLGTKLQYLEQMDLLERKNT